MKEKFGLDFYDDIINHSYDSHPNQRIRLEMFFNEIKRLSNMKTELIDFYKNNYERFEANKQKVLKILEIDTAVTELENLRQFAYFHLGQFENAIAWQNEIIEKYPNADNYYAAACLYSLLNKIDKSIEHLTIAFQKGFRTFRLMEAEEEMDNVSKTKEFKKLIANWKSIDK
jgi:tetratricopeptide (TPR) repeat protein